jgi:NADH dehydrogenase
MISFNSCKNSPSIVITGANGFLGHHTIQIAHDMGYNVKGIVRHQKGALIVQEAGGNPILIDELSVSRCKTAFQDCFALIHFVGITDGSLDDFKRINLGSLKIVLEAAQQVGLFRIIVPSGLGVDQVGKKQWANNAYFQSKQQMELFLEKNPIPYVIFRPSYIIGPGDELLPSLIQQIQQGSVTVIGEGNTPLQPIFIEDAAHAFLTAATGFGPKNQIYDLVGPEIISMNDLITRTIQILSKFTGTLFEPQIHHIPLQNAPQLLHISQEDVDVSQCDIVGDNSLLQKQLNITLTPIDHAISSVIKSMNFDEKIK